MKKNQAASSAPPRVQPPKDQLLVHDGIRMTVAESRWFPENLIRILISLCGSIGTIWVLHGFFDFPIKLKPLFLFVIGMTLVMRVIRMLSPKVGFGCILASFASIPLLLLKFREAAVVGTGAVYHIMRRAIFWRIQFPPEEAHAGEWSEAQCVQFVFFLIAIALVALFEYSDVLLTHSQSSRSGFWIRLLVTFPFLECGLYFGIETHSLAVFMLAVFWLGTIALARKKPANSLLNKQGCSASLQQTFLASAESRFSAHETGAAFLLCVSALLTVLALLASKGYYRTEEMNQKRSELKEFYRNMTIDDVTGMLQYLPDSFGMNVTTDEVNLVENSDLHFDGRPVLHLDIGAAATPDDYYLRGIVRAEYTGTGWAIPNAAYRSQRRLFKHLTAENRMPQTVFHSDHIDELRNKDGKYPVVRCNVEALSMETVNYLPYQSIYDIGTRYRYDIETELENTKNYKFWILNNAQTDWQKFTRESAPSPNEYVSQYEKFVEDQYLTLPDSDAIHRIAEMVRPDIPDPSLPLINRLYQIRDYIWARAEYTMQPGVQPADEDFVEYFLTKSHKGYCAHYASAAAILCRMSGIPARYCQGYVLTESNFNSAEIDRMSGDYSILIPDDQAHAWVEIYVKGYGWIPFEFTETVADTWHRARETTPPSDASTTTTPAVTTVTSLVPATTNSRQTNLPNLEQTKTNTTTTAAGGSVPGGEGRFALPPRVLVVMIRTILTIAGLVTAALLYWLLHTLICNRREKAMQAENPNDAAHAAYTFIMQLLQMYGVEQKKLTHDMFADKAEEMCTLLKKGRIRRAIAIQQAAVFSRNGISAADAKQICQTARELADALYRHAKPLQKLWLRWGRHIIK